MKTVIVGSDPAENGLRSFIVTPKKSPALSPRQDATSFSTEDLADLLELTSESEFAALIATPGGKGVLEKRIVAFLVEEQSMKGKRVTTTGIY